MTTAITPEFLMDLETNMEIIASREYQRLTSNLWWTTVAKTKPSSSLRERLIWLLETARIERPHRGGGQAIFEDIVSLTTEYENEPATAGLRLKKEQLEDLDGNGVDLATHWATQMGAYAAYWPQKMIADAIKKNPVTYDGRPFFDTAHPVNPFNPKAGTFANVFTGAEDGAYPGALPIDRSVPIETAVDHLARAIAYLASVKLPNGEDPRMLRLAHLIVPPALASRAQQLTNAKFIAQTAAGGGAGSGDVEAVIRDFGLGQPIVARELGASFGGSDTSYYLGVEEITSSPLGAFTYVNREPFSILFHGPMTDAELGRTREFQWTTNGRNTVGPGHPFLLYRCDAR